MKVFMQKMELRRKTAGVMAVILTTMAFLPYVPPIMVSFADYAQLIEAVSLPSWDAARYDADNNNNYTATGLMYENKVFHLGSPVKEGNFPAGAKQYLVENKQHSKGEFKEFDKTFIYCVQGHNRNTMIHLGSQAFFEKYWTATSRPEEFPKDIGNEELEKFNFLMNVYGSYMGKNDSIEACNDANAGTAKYIVASVINWIAADECAFTGIDLATDLKIFKGSDNYQAVIKQMNPNAVGDRSVYSQLFSTQIPEEYKAKGCTNWAEWMFGQVWDAATITSKLDVDAEETIYHAKIDHATETYTITVPYPNAAVKDYYQRFSAKDLYGDWTYNGPTDAGLVFSSQSGEVPTDVKGIGVLYWANPGQYGLELAKDIGSAKLATFKFYTQDPGDPWGLVYTFDASQTYFVAKLDKDLEVHVVPGSLPNGVKRYKHTEAFGANYNVSLSTFDSETGKPLAGSRWDILEKFDDSQLDDTDLDLDGPESYSSNLGSLTGASWEEDAGGDEERISTNYSGDTGLNDSGANLYNQGNSSGSQFKRWSNPENDPCSADDHITNQNGELHYVDSLGRMVNKKAHSDAKSYTYEKGYCSGHPAPVIEYEEVPEPEYDEETGEQTNEDEIEAVEQYNQALHDTKWAEWLAGVQECERLVEKGGFFHAIDPSGAPQKEALEQDRDQLYKEFISLNYEYSAKETTPAPGYALHGSHPDDIPLEWRTVSSSEYKNYRSSGMRSANLEEDSISLDTSLLQKDDFTYRQDLLMGFGTVEQVDLVDEKDFIVSDYEEETERETEVEDSSENETIEQQEETQPEMEAENQKETEAEEAEEASSEAIEATTEAETQPEISAEVPEETTAQEETQESQAETLKETIPETLPLELPQPVKKKKATLSQADAIDGGISFTGFLEQIKASITSSLRMVADKTNSLFKLTSKKKGAGGSSSLSSLPESTETSRISPPNSSSIDWTFIVYDHRVEGDIHINKKDMDLKKGESGNYNAYGDTQGDGSMEGAVYGLFAATDVSHPDGHSGVVFQKADLVSVATTDRNGEASFLTITQAPGYTYNYQTGAIEKRSGGFADRAPTNLYTSMGKAVSKESDIERFEGHTSGGSSISMTDSRSETASGYQKLSSNQGRDGTGESSHFYPIENNETLNGNAWIGRPLLVGADGTQYYIKELTRSEGYELSVYGKDAAHTNREAFEAGGNPSAEGTVSAGSLEVDRLKKSNTFTIKSSGATYGYQIYALGIPAGASFYETRSQIVEDPKGTHTEYVSREETALAEEAGAKVIINGQSVAAKAGDTISLPNGESVVVSLVSQPEYDYTAVRPDNALRYTIPTFEDKKNTEDLMEDANAALKKASFKEPDEGAPWMLIPVEGETFEEQAKSLYKGMEDAGLFVFNCLRIEEMTDENAVVRYSYRVGTSISSGIYDEARKIVLVKQPITYKIKGAEVNGYIYLSYPVDRLEDYKENSNCFLTFAKVKAGELSKKQAVFPEDLSKITLQESPERTYWVYDQGEPIRNNDGSIKKVMVEEEIQVAPGYELKDVDAPVTAVYDGTGYTIEASGGEGTETKEYRIKYNTELMEGTYTTPQEYAEYYGNISVTPKMASAGSYIESVTLRYDRTRIDSDGGTRQAPVSLQGRPIMQKVKITKDISVQADGTYEDNTYAKAGGKDKYTEQGGGTEDNATYKKNFRFKVYLKSNLERLYRAEDGSILWQDRNGNTVDIKAYRTSFPEKAQKLYTNVDHETTPLKKNSNQAAIANTELYSYTDGLIGTDQNTGYTAILEKGLQKVKDEAGNDREISGYNYEKFFDGIKVANEDKWDRTDNGSTSFKPFAWIKQLLFGTAGGQKEYPFIHNNLNMRNNINTSEEAESNSQRSDHIRQFAITWYLDDEVAKLVKQNPAGEREGAFEQEKYPDELYDKALSEAFKKAENYLKPFFSYDLDEIYSIHWDSEEEGGKDKDTTTLSADQEDAEAGYCYGVSEYLPYGTYVAVEQQPFSKDLGDLFNKHYKTDAPKEIELPAVYEGGKAGSDLTPEAMSHYYNYNASDSVAALSSKYHIRFNEEWPGENGEDKRKYVIRAHSRLGDYEIYPYGLDLQAISGSSPGDPSGKGHFTITQERNDPGKDYYNTLVYSKEAGGSPDSHYLADDGNAGKRTPNGFTYETDGVEKIYRYGSISEVKQIYDQVAFPSGSGVVYQDHVTAMEGMQTAYDGKYASMLVPWSMTEPANEQTDAVQNQDGTSSYKGYGYRKFTNTFYKSRLRIEKLDSETGENILHDGAIFALYAASREDGETTDGLVKFYETDTRIKGSKEFLEAMGADKIDNSGLLGETGQTLWTGIVPAGTPICEEAKQVILSDQEGRRTGQFEAFTTTRDGLQAKEEDNGKTEYQDQNTGYLVTPQPLGAGTYVLCEIKPPAGYVRTKPVAIEVYSDQTTYYLDGNLDERVAAAIYENKDLKEKTARIYVANTPVRLEVSKIKDSAQTVTYQTETRVEGTELELKQRYGAENLEFGYKNGTYLGYGWFKGTLESLLARKEAGEDVEPVYLNGVFAGYGLVSRPLDTADDKNRYAAGAKMALYNAIEIKENGDSGDYGYDGVEVTRDRNNNVQSIKVKKGYAGTTVEFINKQDQEGSLLGETGEGTWTYQTVDREDTDILFYSLADLTVTEAGADGTVYGYDRNSNKVSVKNRESIFVLKAGTPVFELAGGDLTKVRYTKADKLLTLPSETILYHLDSEGNRDAFVNPSTGMAYTRSSETDPKDNNKLMVWPVKLSKNKTGAIIAREKIRTFRIATMNADTDQEYTTGTYQGNTFQKSMNPVFNSHGLPEYYQKSNETYKKGDPIYDIDGDYVRYKYDDLLEAFNRVAYRINHKAERDAIGEEEDITDDPKLYYRQGQAWVMENTWITGETYPNDPFQSEKSVGQADMLKRVIPGTYIMEEVKAPSGYQKGFPQGITVTEHREVQTTSMEDPKIKVEITKTDASSQYRIPVTSDYDQGSDSQASLIVTEPKGTYSYQQITGAHLVLYKAKRVSTTDSNTYPKGYYLVKAEDKPAEWTVENTEDNAPVRIVADWITDGKAKYFEGIPAGDYILEETEAASGYVRTSMEITVKAAGDVQTFDLTNDHTKLEVYKYYLDSKGNWSLLPNDHAAGLALYEAKIDQNGTILMEGGKPQYDPTKKVGEWTTDNLSDYTELTEKSMKFTDRIKGFLGITDNKSSFLTDFEAAYREKGEELTYLTWYTKSGMRSAERTGSTSTGKGESITQTWITDTGATIRITIYRNVTNGALDSDGKLPLIFEYQFNYKEYDGIKSYDTLEGMHRFDYLPLNVETNGKKMGAYVLVEEKVPDGFEPADPKAITLAETGAVQRVSLQNEEKFINVLKVVTDKTNQYAAEGAELALYRADETGSLLKDETHLIETWISGSDGRYTKEDQFNDKIIDGFQVGDRKPHLISKIPYGTYYIVEVTPPAYMQKADPVKIEVGAEKIPVYRYTNHPTVGALEINKKASDTTEGLENARFKVTNQDTGAVWYMTTGTKGSAILRDLPVGKVQTDGTVKAYTYTVEEISPPDFYQITAGVRKFQFNGAESGTEVTYSYEVLNNPTEIHFRKTDFNTGMAVKGAEIAVYEAAVVNGEYQKNGAAIATVVSGDNGFTLTKKIKANQVYIMEELKAPAGYTLSKPVIFTVNKAGTGIKNVSNDFNVLKLASDNGFIEALTVTGRVPVKVYTIIKDLDTGYELPALIGTGENQKVTAMDGITEGHLYEITEYTKYSDGRSEKSHKETRRIYLNEDGAYTLPSRTYLGTRQELTDREGNVLASWAVNHDNHDYTILNPVIKEVPIAKVTSSIGADHGAVKTGNVIKYSITYTNTYSKPADIRIKAAITDGLEYLRSTDYGTEQNGIITWNLTDVAAHETGTVDVVVVVNGETGSQAKAWFETRVNAVSKRTVLSNPIVQDGSITIINKLTGTGIAGSTGDAENQSDTFTYHVKLTDQNGTILTGYQAFKGTLTGRIKGEGTITLSGDGYITFTGLPYGTRYEINQEPTDNYELEGGIRTGEIQKTLQSAVFINNRDDYTIREILTAGGNYCLTETTEYSDKNSITSGIYRFSINNLGMVDNLDMEDRPVKLNFLKVNRETGQIITGGHYSLIDAISNKVLYEFTMTEAKLVEIPSQLINSGQPYIVREDIAPDGYSYENDILFTADNAGISETIVMEDKQTEVYIQKTDEETGTILSGGRFSLLEKDTGKLIKSFTFEGKQILIKGQLIAGKSYELIEEEPPAGYAYSEKIEFMVPREPTKLTVTMKDKKTTIIIKKTARAHANGTPSEAESLLPGNILQILNEDKSPAKAIRNSDTYKIGEELIFTTTEEMKVIKGQLLAGHQYWIHEVKPAKGYSYGEDVPFTVSLDGKFDEVLMVNDETHVILSKKSIKDQNELPGNLMSIRDKNGAIIERWISTQEPHHIFGKLAAGESYFLCEDKPQKGYAYAESVLFTVEMQNEITPVEMVNDTTKIKIHKVDSKGRQLKGAVLRIVNMQGNVVIPDFTTGPTETIIEGQLEAGEKYILKEIEPPEGYQFSEPVEFSVPRANIVADVFMTDLKTPGKTGGDPIPLPPPPQPDLPNEPSKVGKVTAFYQKVPLNPSWLELIYGKKGKIKGEKTGDHFSFLIWTMGVFISLTGTIITLKIGKQKKEQKKAKQKM
ncbi:hypothetical protein LXJ15735_34120 [Lacrimispora xylanolytica]